MAKVAKHDCGRHCYFAAFPVTALGRHSRLLEGLNLPDIFFQDGKGCVFGVCFRLRVCGACVLCV